MLAPIRAPGMTPSTKTNAISQSMCPRAACTIVPGIAMTAMRTRDVPSARFSGIPSIVVTNGTRRSRLHAEQTGHETGEPAQHRVLPSRCRATFADPVSGGAPDAHRLPPDQDGGHEQQPMGIDQRREPRARGSRRRSRDRGEPHGSPAHLVSAA